MKDEKPRIRTKQWLAASHSFVKRHCSLPQFDAFNNHPMGLGDDEAMRLRIDTHLHFHGKGEKNRDLATDTVMRVDALKKLREKIHD